MTISEVSTNCGIGRGVINPVLLEVEVEKDSQTILFRLPPRYKSHEAELAEVLDIGSIRDIGVVKGLRAIKRWIAENIGTQSVTRPRRA